MNSSSLRVGFLASHSGTTMQALLDAWKAGELAIEPTVVISNNSGSRALQRAVDMGVETLHLSSRTHADPQDLDEAIRDELASRHSDLVVLAGYTKHLGQQTVHSFAGRIFNIHPSLLPKHGGQGMYGAAVHEAVIAQGDTESGNTIHLVDDVYDHGKTIAQSRIAVLPNDTPETLAERILDDGYKLFVTTLKRVASGEIELPVR